MTGRGSSSSSRRQSPSAKSGKAASDDGSGKEQSCEISFSTILASPDANVVRTLTVGSVLDVVIVKVSIREKDVPSLVTQKDRQTAGSIDDLQAANVIACIGRGFKYKATVLRITGGEVLVSITKQ
jgi:aconitase B